MYAKPRLADPVRTAGVRAVVITALTLVQLMAAVLCSLAGEWTAFPLGISTVVSTIVTTWAVLDVWVTRQVWVQRHGVVSVPSSVARRGMRTAPGAAAPRPGHGVPAARTREQQPAGRAGSGT